jgi:energy-coupling factor transporter ATP-binding protein EcfA2
MIRIENLTFRYHADGEPVLRNVDLTIKAGESVAVMGANGSGKSTLARIVAGLLTATQGRVTVHTPGNFGMPVGILFQNPDNQFVAVTVEKEIAFSLENLGESLEQMEKKVTETLQRFEIPHLRKRLMAELSADSDSR